MSETVQETFLSSVADNVVDSLFNEGATSTKNILVPEPKEVEKKDEKPEEKKIIKNEGIKDLNASFNAIDLVGDILEKPVEDLIEFPEKKKEVVEPSKKTEEDYSFLIDKGVLAGFEDDSAVKSKEDLEKLIKGNKEQWVEETRLQTLKDEYEGLPEQVRLIVDYAKQGGQDFKSLFGLLSKNEEIRSYDVEKAEDQRAIIRNYYSAQDWSEDEIEEEIISLVEAEKLKSQAERLKPKLDKINQELIEDQKEQQKYIETERTKAQQFFVGNVVDTLKKGKLGDLTLSKEDQQDIYKALVSETYQSFGGNTNRLGALLDKIQYIEPNYELLAKITMYLSDPVAFEEKIRTGVTTEVAAKTVKKIKIDQNKQKIGSEYNPEKDTKALPKLRSGFVNPFE